MHIYLDKSGDTWFKFVGGSSGYFAVAPVLVPDVAAAEEAVRVLRAALNEPEGYEFKFARMPHHLRVAVLRGLVGRRLRPCAGGQQAPPHLAGVA